MKPGKSLLMMIGPKDKGDDDESPPESGPVKSGDDDKAQTKLDTMRAFIGAVKNNDPEAAVDAFGDLCDLHGGGEY